MLNERTAVADKGARRGERRSRPRIIFYVRRSNRFKTCFLKKLKLKLRSSKELYIVRT